MDSIKDLKNDENCVEKKESAERNDPVKAEDDEMYDDIVEKDRFIVSTNSRVYRLVRYLGKGGYGEVYECISETTKKVYAVKKENISRTKLPSEIEVLKRANDCDCKQICKYIDDGKQDDYVFVVMTLLGKDLSKLRHEQETKHFTTNTVIRVGLLTFSAIRELHEIFVISRDIKPSNFALGINEQSRNIFILDFGLAQFFKNQDGTILPRKHHTGFCGTTRYASLRAHQKLELGRRDDLESWVYVMVELCTGILPWRIPPKTKKTKEFREQVYRAKLRIRLDDERKKFFENTLPILNCIFIMIDALNFEAEPPYEKIQHMFEELMLETNVKWDDLYDWEEAASTQLENMASKEGVTSTSIAIGTHSIPFQAEARILTESTESSS